MTNFDWQPTFAKPLQDFRQAQQLYICLDHSVELNQAASLIDIHSYNGTYQEIARHIKSLIDFVKISECLSQSDKVGQRLGRLHNGLCAIGSSCGCDAVHHESSLAHCNSARLLLEGNWCHMAESSVPSAKPLTVVLCRDESFYECLVFVDEESDCPFLDPR